MISNTTQHPQTPSQQHTGYIVYTVMYFDFGKEWWQNFTKLGRTHQHDWLYLQSINSMTMYFVTQLQNFLGKRLSLINHFPVNDYTVVVGF